MSAPKPNTKAISSHKRALFVPMAPSLIASPRMCPFEIAFTLNCHSKSMFSLRTYMNIDIVPTTPTTMYHPLNDIVAYTPMIIHQPAKN